MAHKEKLVTIVKRVRSIRVLGLGFLFFETEVFEGRQNVSQRFRA